MRLPFFCAHYHSFTAAAASDGPTRPEMVQRNGAEKWCREMWCREMVRNGTHCWLLCGLIPSAGRMAARIAYQRALTVRRRRQAALPERHAARQKSKVKSQNSLALVACRRQAVLPERHAAWQVPQPGGAQSGTVHQRHEVPSFELANRPRLPGVFPVEPHRRMCPKLGTPGRSISVTKFRLLNWRTARGFLVLVLCWELRNRTTFLIHQRHEVSVAQLRIRPQLPGALANSPAPFLLFAKLTARNQKASLGLGRAARSR